jgi:hypothetical protein
LRIITGLQKPTEGLVLYRDVPLQGVNPHASIVFQIFALFPWLNVIENVELALEVKGMPALLRASRAIDLLDRVGLDGFENAYPRELSGGMRQKVGFARAMAVEPELLCLDEKAQNRSDIYRLAEELAIDSDKLLSLTEAAELLGFAHIEKGDIMLTSLGETFSEASILARKEIFATRIRRLPLFRWLTELLRRADKSRLNWDVVQTALELEFYPEEAERQLDTIINWGRYAEVLAYDDDSEMIYLETNPVLP